MHAKPAGLGPQASVEVPGEARGALRGSVDRQKRRRSAGDIPRDARQPNEEVLGLLAHELRNPLTGLSGILELVYSSLQDGRPARREEIELLETALAEARRLWDILSSVVEAERSGQAMQLQRSAADLREILKAAARPMLRGTHPIIIECDQPGPVRVHADRQRMEQVFRNLLGNAEKYSPPGSLIRLSLRTVHEGVLSTVRDEGVGIPPEESERVFERFYRASNVHGQDPGGVGLGLYLCRRIVEAHGGRIWAERLFGGGAAIHVLLPEASA